MDYAVLEQVGEETRDVSCIHLAGVERHRAGEVYGAHDDDAMLHDFLAWLRESAVPTLFSREIYDDRARSHTPDHLFGDEDRSALAWNERRRDDGVSSRHVFKHNLLLLFVDLVRLRLRVTALFLRIFRFKTEVRELGAKTFHLFLYGGARVVGLHYSAEPLRRADRLQPCHARANDEDTRWRHRTCSGHEQREDLRQATRCDQHGLVPRDGAHGAQSVHGLGARDARHELHGERRDPARGQGSDLCHARVRLEKAYERRACFHSVDFSGCGGLDFKENVGIFENVRLDACARVNVGGVQKSSRRAGAGLHDDLQARFGELWNELGNKRHAPFAKSRLFWDADDHLRR